jgi:hypothetical protein
MQVNSLGNGAPEVPPGRGHPKRAASARVEGESVVTPPPQRARGVIRQLQAGHFQGVADVRLRINFAEEIAALQSQATSRVVAPGPEAVSAEVNRVIDAFIAQNDLDSETIQQVQDARDALELSLSSTFEAFASSGDVNGQSLIDAVSATINEFIGTIEALLPVDLPEVNPEAVDVEAATVAIQGEVPADGVVSATTEDVLPLAQLVTQLRDALDNIIQGLQTQFDAAQVLPPLSASNGNGRAYDRFVAILNGLYGQDSGSVDTAA